jgi:hypothetical protein
MATLLKCHSNGIKNHGMKRMNELSTTSLFILDKTLRSIFPGIENISENLGKQRLSECFMPDLSDINPHDEAIKSALDLIGIRSPDPELKQIHQYLSFRRDAIADTDQVKILHRFGVSGSNLNHLDQLLTYVGAPTFSKTFNLVSDQVNNIRPEIRGESLFTRLGFNIQRPTGGTTNTLIHLSQKLRSQLFSRHLRKRDSC